VLALVGRSGGRARGREGGGDGVTVVAEAGEDLGGE